MTVPGASEVLARIEARKADDFFGFEVGDYVDALPFASASAWLKPETTEAQWEEGRLKTREEVVERMRGYMEFAFGKANDQRGLSANRSVMHVIAWTWLAGDRELSESVEREYDEDYKFYGKLILRRVCEHYGWDWRQWDDGELTNG